ncbi:hypothetical protein [Neolewinella antarctica]|uniref:Uncharacterized protein n=1 Tax=Neolewinella antarctica TaxID=442734 RepID=A0ABX0XBN5_9BACT|nr:hypothetical protein [Neolewinella antarctica]NJC26339.1 hypothetical protein [Neolewinella antarctica]
MRTFSVHAALTLLFCTFLCTCSRAPADDVQDLVIGNLRYQERSQLLDATVEIRREDTSTTYSPPTVFNFPMQKVPRGGELFKYRRPMQYPAILLLDVPCHNDRCPLELRFPPVSVAAIPDVIARGQKLRAPIGRSALGEGESLLYFFESTDRSAPRQIQILGPTASNVVTLPKAAVSTIAPGEYELYLIKQKLVKDSTSKLRSSFQLAFYTNTKPVTVTD